jgi:hypothetical protein
MELLVRRPCEACGGRGKIPHPLWAENWRADPDLPHKLAEWWAEHGYPEQPPPEELTCVRCRGTGRREDWVEISRLLRDEAVIRAVMEAIGAG